MKTSKFSEEQISYIPQQAEEGTAIGEVCRSAGMDITSANAQPAGSSGNHVGHSDTFQR